MRRGSDTWEKVSPYISGRVETNSRDNHGPNTGSLNPSAKTEYLYRRVAEINAKEVAIIAECHGELRSWSVLANDCKER